MRTLLPSVSQRYHRYSSHEVVESSSKVVVFCVSYMRGMDDGKLAVLFMYLATVMATPVVGSCMRKIGSKLATRYGAMVLILLFPMMQD